MALIGFELTSACAFLISHHPTCCVPCMPNPRPIIHALIIATILGRQMTKCQMSNDQCHAMSCHVMPCRSCNSSIVCSANSTTFSTANPPFGRSKRSETPSWSHQDWEKVFWEGGGIPSPTFPTFPTPSTQARARGPMLLKEGEGRGEGRAEGAGSTT